MQWYYLVVITLAVLATVLGGGQCRTVKNMDNATKRKPLPIVFIPGKGGAQLEARVDPSRTMVGTRCTQKHRNWFRLWLNVWDILRGDTGCWSECMRLHYNASTGRSSALPGVETRVPGWGSTEVMEYVDPSWSAWLMGNVGHYAGNLIDVLVKRGYKRGVDLRGAPYDFRYAPHSQADYFQRLERLIEDTYVQNGGRRVVLLAHSMGGLFASYFLAGQPQRWKNRHVRALLTINTPWTGAVVVAGMYASGHNWEIDAVDRLVIRAQQRSYETAVLLLPKPETEEDRIQRLNRYEVLSDDDEKSDFEDEHYNQKKVEQSLSYREQMTSAHVAAVHPRDIAPTSWTASDVIVQTVQRNFTAFDYEELFTAIGHKPGSTLLERIASDRRYTTGHPGVEVHCFYGSGVPTPETIVYDNTIHFPDGKPIYVYGDGDGTVNERSLRACRQWRESELSERYRVVVRRFQGVGHKDLLYERRMIARLLALADSE